MPFSVVVAIKSLLATFSSFLKDIATAERVSFVDQQIT